MHNPQQNMLRAKGNLSYLDFVRLVTRLWEAGNPKVPLRATGDKNAATYPVIIYRLDLRKPHGSEPKPRLREQMPTAPGEKAVLIHGMRFQNVITFTAVDQRAQVVEELIEAFENFMMEMQPIFKEEGASELTYMRRLPDSHDQRPGEGIVSRSVSYLLTTEKIIKTEIDKLEKFSIDARIYLGRQDVTFTSDPDDDTIIIDGPAFKIGDRVKVTESLVLPSGYYLISNVVISPSDRKYTLAKEVDGGYEPVDTIEEGSGRIVLCPDTDITVLVVDQEAS